jgi:hypothetical protein
VFIDDTQRDTHLMPKPNVTPIDLGVRWEPNVPAPVLVQTEGDAWLIFAPHFDDPNSDPVVFHWIDCWGALLGTPNDEARSGHPLWRHGLRDSLWAGEVANSPWIADLEQRDRVHPRHDPSRFEGLRHFILKFHDSTFEAIARGVEYTRGVPRAVLETLGGEPS